MCNGASSDNKLQNNWAARALLEENLRRVDLLQPQYTLKSLTSVTDCVFTKPPNTSNQRGDTPLVVRGW